MQNSNKIMAPFRNPLMRFISEPKFRWLRHTLFIILCLILGFKGDIGKSAYDTRTPEMLRAFLMMDIWTFTIITGMIYLLILVLIPKLLFRSRVFWFAVCFLIMVSLIYFVAWYVEYKFLVPVDTPDHPFFQYIDLSFVTYIQYAALSSVLLGSVVGLCVFKKWIIDVQQMNELYATNLRTELEQLKSQVNPHFLFNTLNNLYVLTKTDPAKASQVLLGLSDLLRYQLYDSSKEKILLTRDIDFVQNLLSLEKIRKNDFEYAISTEGDMEGVSLPPFLFIPFVENAIKHGASSVGHSYLHLSFKIKDNHLHFHSENSKPYIRKNGIGGLGLVNIKRRLQLLYPGKHELHINDDADKYIVNLILPL